MMEKILQSDELALIKAKEAILNDRVICFKSDTVYGFACNALSEKAVGKLYKLKKRDEKKPIAIFVNDLEMAQKIFEFDDLAVKFCDKYLPGQLTVVLKVKEIVDFKISTKLNLESNFLGFRIIEGDFVNDLISSLGFPLAVTSANLANSRELLSGDQIREVFQESDGDFLLIDDGECESKGVSTVVKIYNGSIEILRQGIVKID